MLSNAYFLAKFRFDTAENEPAKNLPNFAKIANFPNFATLGRPAGDGSAPPWRLGRAAGQQAKADQAKAEVPQNSQTLRQHFAKTDDYHYV